MGLTGSKIGVKVAFWLEKVVLGRGGYGEGMVLGDKNTQNVCPNAKQMKIKPNLQVNGEAKQLET